MLDMPEVRTSLGEVVYTRAHTHTHTHTHIPGYNSSKEKARLQNVMAFGSELEPLPVAGSNQRDEREEEGGELDRFDEGETKR